MRKVVVALCAWALLAACGGGRGSPRDALESLRGALTARDGETLRDLLDAESIAFRTQRVREWRAMLARGEDAASVLSGLPLSAEEVCRGSELDVVALVVGRSSPLLEEADWYLRAGIVDEQAESDTAARLKLRGADGVERDLWFIRENGRWCFDQYRTRRPWQ